MRKIAHSPTPRENLLPLKRFDVMDINSVRSMHSLLKSNCTIGFDSDVGITIRQVSPGFFTKYMKCI